MVLNQWDETVVTIAEVDRSEMSAGGEEGCRWCGWCSTITGVG